MRLNQLLFRALLIAAALAPSAVRAGTVKGTVTQPEGTKSGRRYLGYWHLENGIVPVQPAAAGKADTVVVLEGIKVPVPPARTVTVELVALEAVPRVLVVGPGSVVEFKNTDRVSHDLSVPDQPSFMPIERLNPGTLRRQKFSASGGYLVRCSEYPHVAVSVIVVDNPHFAVADDRGVFSLAGVPDGKATLKVWTQGRWAHEQAIEVGSKSGDLSIKLAPAPQKEAAE